jgi:hypothetical protein
MTTMMEVLILVSFTGAGGFLTYLALDAVRCVKYAV